jgi:hypothetical protein
MSAQAEQTRGFVENLVDLVGRGGNGKGKSRPVSAGKEDVQALASSST